MSVQRPVAPPQSPSPALSRSIGEPRSPARIARRLVAPLPLAAALLLAPPTPARACGARNTTDLTAFPSTGASAVPPTTAIIVMGPPGTAPPQLVLAANGSPVTLPPPEPMGTGRNARGVGDYWRLVAPLQPSTTYTLRNPYEDPPRELTRFETAPTAEAPAVTAPRLRGLHLWRVSYPEDQVGHGSCVFSTTEGYLAIDYDPGTVVGTPADELVYTLTLSPKAGGMAQSFTFSGDRFYGSSTEGGSLPLPVSAEWKPTLNPQTAYCASLAMIGRGSATTAATSNSVCAEVKSASNSGGCDFANGKPGCLAMLAAVGALAALLPWARRRTGRCPRAA